MAENPKNFWPIYQTQRPLSNLFEQLLQIRFFVHFLLGSKSRGREKKKFFDGGFLEEYGIPAAPSAFSPWQKIVLGLIFGIPKSRRIWRRSFLLSKRRKCLVTFCSNFSFTMSKNQILRNLDAQKWRDFHLKLPRIRSPDRRIVCRRGTMLSGQNNMVDKPTDHIAGKYTPSEGLRKNRVKHWNMRLRRSFFVILFRPCVMYFYPRYLPSIWPRRSHKTQQLCCFCSRRVPLKAASSSSSKFNVVKIPESSLTSSGNNGQNSSLPYLKANSFSERCRRSSFKFISDSSSQQHVIV